MEIKEISPSADLSCRGYFISYALYLRILYYTWFSSSNPRNHVAANDTAKDITIVAKAM